VTAQYLLKSESPDSEHDYSWIVCLENQGTSPFGSANACQRRFFPSELEQ
jgi:hypothetical protein